MDSTTDFGSVGQGSNPCRGTFIDLTRCFSAIYFLQQRYCNGKGELVASDIELQAELLRADDFDMDNSKTKPKVVNFRNFI